MLSANPYEKIPLVMDFITAANAHLGTQFRPAGF